MATVTPSLVTVGEPKRLLDDDVAALGAERHLDGPGELADAAPHRFAGFLVERNHLGHGGVLR